MTMKAADRNKTITRLLNGTLTAIKNVIPIKCKMRKSKLLNQDLRLNFGVLIGITGDLEGRLVFTGEPLIFV